MTKHITADHLPLEVEHRIFAYKEQSWSPLDIAKQLQLELSTVNAVIRRGVPVVRYQREDGKEVCIAPQQVWDRRYKAKVTRCDECGANITTNYCLRCAVAKHKDVRA